MSDYIVPKIPYQLIQETSQPDYNYSTIYLIATIIGNPNGFQIAQAIVDKYQTIQRIAKLQVEDLLLIKGMTKTKTQKLLSAILLGRNSLLLENFSTPITNPESIANILVPMLSNRVQECLVVINLDTRNRVIKLIELYRGTLNCSTTRVSEIFKSAIQLNAAAIIIAHNHPSGDDRASPEDIALTRTVIQAGKLLDIQVLDHMIIGSGKWTSLKQAGLGF